MSLKLFRATEFADSRNYSPERERRAMHPAWIVVLTSVWLALVGNLVLWRALAQLPELRDTTVWWFGLRVAVLIAAVHCVLLGTLMWRRTLKPAAILLMLATAWASTMLANTSDLGPLRWLVGLALLAVLPGALLWRTTVRRLPPWRNLAQVGVLVAAACTIFALALLFSFKELSALSRQHPELRNLVSPYSAAGKLSALEKALLTRKQ